MKEAPIEPINNANAMAKEASSELSKVFMNNDVRKLTEYLFNPGDLDIFKSTYGTQA
jgi:hypothetical protein